MEKKLYTIEEARELLNAKRAELNEVGRVKREYEERIRNFRFREHRTCDDMPEYERIAYALQESTQAVNKRRLVFEAAKEIFEDAARREIQAHVSDIFKGIEGKAAGPKTRDKFTARIAEIIGARYVCIGYSPSNIEWHMPNLDYNEKMHAWTVNSNQFIDNENKFVRVDFTMCETLRPVDVEAWADEFIKSRVEIYEKFDELKKFIADRRSALDIGYAQLPYFNVRAIQDEFERR